MKKMKITAILGLMALMIAPTMNSCKKGEDDPTSLRSRKARLTGEWKLSTSEMKTEEVQSGTGTNTSVTDEKYADGKFTRYETETFSGLTERDTITGTKTNTLTFEKDGTFKTTEQSEYTTVETEEYFFYTEETTSKMTEEITFGGTWDFNDGVGEMNSKQMVFLFFTEGSSKTTIVNTIKRTENDGTVSTRTETSTSTSTVEVSGVAQDFGMQVFNLSRLANDEMVVDMSSEFNVSSVSTFNDGSSTFTSNSTSKITETGNMTFIKE